MIRLRVVALGLAIATGVAPVITAAEGRRSGFDFMSPALQAMQNDDAENPAQLWVKEGEVLFKAPAGAAGKACASCHDAKTRPLAGVAAAYPQYEPERGRPMTLAERIDRCREHHQRASAMAPESRERLALEAYVARQSRGRPIAPYRDARMSVHFSNGEKWFRTRMGQLDLSCADCHEKNAGRKLGGNPIPEAHPTAYPIYRLEWQGVGSLQRRLRNCMAGIRAEPFDYGAIELAELETYLMSRAAGMAIESPGVRP